MVTRALEGLQATAKVVSSSAGVLPSPNLAVWSAKLTVQPKQPYGPGGCQRSPCAIYLNRSFSLSAVNLHAASTKVYTAAKYGPHAAYLRLAAVP